MVSHFAVQRVPAVTGSGGVVLLEAVAALEDGEEEEEEDAYDDATRSAVGRRLSNLIVTFVIQPILREGCDAWVLSIVLNEPAIYSHLTFISILMHSVLLSGIIHYKTISR